MSAFKSTLANEFAYATEGALETLSGLLLKKNTAKCEIKRHRSICLRQLGICQAFKSEIEWGDDLHPNFPRVQKVFIEEPLLALALDSWMYD